MKNKYITKITEKYNDDGSIILHCQITFPIPKGTSQEELKDLFDRMVKSITNKNL